jgi:hypothetical protein
MEGVVMMSSWRILTGIVSAGLLAGCIENETSFRTNADPQPLPTPIMVVEPTTIDFGALPEGESLTSSFVIRNEGTDKLELLEVVMDDSESFTLESPYELPIEIDVGGQLMYEVSYTPNEINEVGSVRVTGSDPENPDQFVELLGTWAVPALCIDPESVDFGELPPECMEETTIVLTSCGTGPLIIEDADLTPLNEGFNWADDLAPELPITLDPGDSIAVDVTFLPTEEIDYLGALVVESNDPAGRKEAELKGRGLEDALCDGVMTFELEFEVDYKIADVAFLLDTTCSMSGTAGAMASEFASIAAALQMEIFDITFGVATYDDYNDAGWGSGQDKPFDLQQQQTNDYARVASMLGTVTIHSGADGPESGHEALYQGSTGDGYDQNCNGGYNNQDDVRPFVANPMDAFNGIVAGAWDPTTPGGGDVGGMGFRENIFPIFVLATDNELRDPDSGYGSPGGCKLDVSFYDVYTSMFVIGAKFIGINTSSWGNEVGKSQMEAIAIVTDSYGDMDGDFDEEPAVVDWSGSSSDFRTTVLDAIYGLTSNAWFDKIALQVNDPKGIVLDIQPEAYYDIQAGTPVTFTLTVAGKLLEAPTANTVEIEAELIADDLIVLSRRSLFIEQ